MYCTFSFQEKSIITWQLRHLVDNSWLPVFISGGRFFIFTRILFWFKSGHLSYLSLIGLIMSLITFFFWFQDITRESSFQGKHTLIVVIGMKWGLFWFLFREVFFFASIFWSFFHFRLAPLNRGFQWPLFGVNIIEPFQVPLLNTLILLIRGISATLGHHLLLRGNKNYWILVRVFLGLYFLSIQLFEYKRASYSINRGAYGRVFFFGTGFHGLHVCLGALMLFFRELRNHFYHFSSFHHFGLEFSLWYWHFVDVVWLFLFRFIYFWGR